jgi:uncharacterized membrane protein YqjE
MPLTPPESNAYSQSLADLIHRLVTQLSTLMRQELTLARVELQTSLGNWGSSIGVLLGAGAVLYAGLLILLAAAVIGLAIIVPLWLAALSIGMVVCAIGFGLLQWGRRLLKGAHLAPSHVSHSLREDKEVLLGKHPL